MNVVVDASAVLSTYDRGPSAETARQLLALAAHHRILAPSILQWEVGNFHVRDLGPRGFRDPQGAAQAIDALLSNVEVEPLVLFQPTIDIAVKCSLTFYDAAYVELATRLPDSILVTLDVRMREAAKIALGKKRVVDVDTAVRRLSEDEPLLP